ncbi:MAG TPA: hypothetical protein VMF91_08515 [Bryobacteraceae bacterium]|nr:hypothetical protein [Bryobacteraceae bacterium]
MYWRALLLTILAAGQLRPMNGQQRDGSEGLSIEYKLVSTNVSLHEPILMRVMIFNHLNSATRINLGQDRRQAFELSIDKPDGKTVLSNLPLHEGASRSWVVGIEPGDTYMETLVLNEWYPFAEVGTYQIRVRLIRVPGAQQELPAGFASWAVLPRVDVLPRDAARLSAVCEELKAKLETSNSYDEVTDAAVELSYLDDPVAVPYLQAMAVFKSGAFSGLAAQGLERVGGEAAANALIALTKDPNLEVSSTARFWLSQLGQATKDPSLRGRISEALEQQ